MWNVTAVVVACVGTALLMSAQSAAAQAAENSDVLARIALVSDPHINGEPEKAAYGHNFSRVIEQVNAANVDAVLLAGDLTEHGDEDSFQRFVTQSNQLKTRKWSVAGNHDVGNKRMPDKGGTITVGRLSQFERLIGPSFYSEQVVPGLRVIAINASLFGSDLPREKEQWDFLEKELDRPREGVTVLLTHYPLFVKAPDEVDDYFNISPEPRIRLHALLKRGGVKAVLSGHLHRPIQHSIDGIDYVGAPAVSFGLPRDKQAVGWRLVTIKKDGTVLSELQYLDPAARPAELLQANPTTAPAQAARGDGSGTIAVLPSAEMENYVFEYFKKKGRDKELKLLRGDEVIDRSKFNAKRYKIALYLSGEQYIRSVRANGDVDQALRAFCEDGGVLVVMGTGPYPFYMDEKGTEAISGTRFGLTFLGNEEHDETVIGFDDPPINAGLRFFVDRERLKGNLDQQLQFPAQGDQRWRPLVRTGAVRAYEPWIILHDRNNKHLGDAAGWVERLGDGGKIIRTAYASYHLTQTHPQRDQILDAIFATVSAKLGAGARADASPTDVSENVHIFYYNWYGARPNPTDFVHWQQGGHTPPDDISSNFYPRLGAYDSADPTVLKQHMAWIRRAGVGVLSLTWWGQKSYEEKFAMPVLDAAAEGGLKVNFHLEPYSGMTPQSLGGDIEYILKRYGGHPAFYRAKSLGNKPMFYVFETLVRHSAAAWRPITDRLRASAEPVLLIAQTSDLNFIKDAGFDGGYPYDILTPFKNEKFLQEWNDRLDREFIEAGKIFIPTVGPGYWDDRAVPKGADEPDAAKTRDDGKATTYEKMWRAAIKTRSPIVTITSFNEWHEGSQIEPAVAKEIPGYRYPAYAEGEMQYIDLTAEWVKRFVQDRKTKQ